MQSGGGDGVGGEIRSVPKISFRKVLCNFKGKIFVNNFSAFSATKTCKSVFLILHVVTVQETGSLMK